MDENSPAGINFSNEVKDALDEGAYGDYKFGLTLILNAQLRGSCGKDRSSLLKRSKKCGKCGRGGQGSR
ncbi:hypothetical protein ISN44_As11g016770 [Arabidopsis suecica]|uniref:Uncharacterized protein n=1 Tax=Arabidopsis suecica TaxID=45249 RepID=A0A8T1Z9G4_ARASU|nr:hypothetical protein ISN44_As11g016770 [Arabidopsis suecica]